MTILPVRTERLEVHAAQAVFFYDTARERSFPPYGGHGPVGGAEGGMAASTLFKRPVKGVFRFPDSDPFSFPL